MKFRLATLIIVSVITPLHAFAAITINDIPVVEGDPNYNALTTNGTYNALPTNGTHARAKEIFDKMKSSSEMFNFATLPKAKEHYKTRVEIVNAMGQMAKGGAIDFWYCYDGVEYPVLDPNAPNVLHGGVIFMSMGPDGGPDITYFKVKNGVKASDAIKCIEGGKTRSECGTALDSAILIGHRRALGDVFIDGKIGPGQLRIDKDFSFLKAATDMNTIIPGDYIYMKNKNDYEKLAKQKPTDPAFWRGERCIYIGGELYSGLGQQEISEGDLREALRKHYVTDTGGTVERPMVQIRFTERERIEIQP